MNFYIGNSLNEIKMDDYNIEFSDDLLQYIYTHRKRIPVDSNVLFEVDPYSDILIAHENVEEIRNICSLCITTRIIENYDNYDEAIEMIYDLLQLANSALLNKKGLISMGD